MYYASRAEAGYKLALELMPYRYEDCVVVCVNEGSVLVGQQIAASIHSLLTMMLIEDIEIPGENVTFGSMNQSGRFTYNGKFSVGEVEEYYAEFHGYLEDQKRVVSSEINYILGAGGIADPQMLYGKNVIMVSDGLSTGASLASVADFLKPIKVKKLITAAVISSVDAMDRMHMLADEVHVLGVTDNFMGTDHYYEDNEVPSHDEIVTLINDIVLNWR
jgi:putative phosphoribosyl transferase